jgi:DNA recombination protein RmuC
MELVYVLLGLLVGGVAGLLATRSRSAAVVARLTAERDSAVADVSLARRERDDARVRLDAAIASASEADRAASEIRARADEAARGYTERLADLERVHDQLRTEFQALSAEALQANQSQFLQLASEALKAVTTEATGDLEQRKQAVEHLVAPLRDTLGKVELQIRQIEVAREGAYKGLLAQVDEMRVASSELRRETGALVTALRKPQVRGQWGEMHLRRAVELAGMVEHCDFTEQASSNTAEGRIRPDLVVQLAGGKCLVVDAKVPLAAFLDAAECTDEAIREAKLKDHARQLRTHVDQLAAKSYWSHMDSTPEFVVMFVPGDSFLAAALDADPSLYEHAATKQVILTTPSTLIGLLRTVAHTWRQEALAANAREVCELGRELYKRLSTMGKHLQNTGKGLRNAVEAYNSTVGSLESQVFPQARRFRDLKVTEAELEELTGVNSEVRGFSVPELLASTEPEVLTLAPAHAPAVVDEEMRRAAGLA